MITPHLSHDITVTPGPVGRAWFECSCGIEQRRASKRAAVQAALVHHHDVGGCNCPPHVLELDIHPTHQEVAA